MVRQDLCSSSESSPFERRTGLYSTGGGFNSLVVFHLLRSGFRVSGFWQDRFFVDFLSWDRIYTTRGAFPCKSYTKLDSEIPALPSFLPTVFTPVTFLIIGWPSWTPLRSRPADDAIQDNSD